MQNRWKSLTQQSQYQNVSNPAKVFRHLTEWRLLFSWGKKMMRWQPNQDNNIYPKKGFKKRIFLKEEGGEEEERPCSGGRRDPFSWRCKHNVPHRRFVGGNEMDCVGMGDFLGFVDPERTVMSLISGRISCISLSTLSIVESSGLLICVCNKISSSSSSINRIIGGALLWSHCVI